METGNWEEGELWKRNVLRVRIWVVGRQWWEGGGTAEFPASLFPGLCRGLIKYGWCLEQCRGKWDSTNSTSNAGSQAGPSCLTWLICLSVFLLSSLNSVHCLPPSFTYPVSLFRPLSLPSCVSAYQTLWWESVSIFFAAWLVCSCLFPITPYCSVHLPFITAPFPSSVLLKLTLSHSLWWLSRCLITAGELRGTVNTLFSFHHFLWRFWLSGLIL